MSGFKYKDFQTGQEKIVSEMVNHVFSEFVAPGYGKEGVDAFHTFTSPERLLQMLETERYFGICCWQDSSLAGFVLVRDYNHISLLFVAKQYQLQGVAVELCRLAHMRCTEKNPFLAEITVNSSPYAVEIYKRIGYGVAGPEQTEDGITFIPMNIRFKSEFDLNEMKIEDYDAIYKLWANTAGISITDVDTKERLGIFLQKNPHLCYVSKKDDRVIGTILCGNDGRRGYIYHCAVDSDFRGHGIGRIMVDLALRQLKELGILKCHLFNFVDNETGKIFWTTLGWKRRDDLLIYSKDLN
jgi:ribosomal protein S18 acetylase RimI-like enzyme